MEILILIGVGILLFLGFIGSIVPVLPGPLLSYLGLLLYHFFIDIDRMNSDSLIWITIVVVVISVLDYCLQIYGVKKSGGGKYAIRGSVVGILLGVFLFPPFGILLGAFIGAFIGGRIEMKKNPLDIAFGALWGFAAGTILKLCFSVYIIYFLLF